MTIVNTGSLPERGWGMAALWILAVERLVLFDRTLVVLGATRLLCPLETGLYLVLAPLRRSDS